MAAADQSDRPDHTEETIPSYRWAVPCGALLVVIAISAVIVALHIMAVPPATL